MKNFFQNLFSYFYQRIFHEEMGSRLKNFLENLSYVVGGTVIAILLSSTFNILAGRVLGREEYGKFTLVCAIAVFLYIPILFGLHTAMVKYGAEKEDFQRQSKIISTTYILVFFLIIISIFFYFLFFSQLSKIFSVSPEIFSLSIIFAVLFAFYTLTTETIRGLNQMKIFAILKSVYGAILLAVFLFFICNKFLSFKSGVFSMYFAYGIAGGVLLVFFLRKYFKFNFDRTWANKLMRYSFWAAIGGVSFSIYTDIDKILINKYLTISDVGIYKAYYFASIDVAVLLFGIFNTVFFPTASRYENKEVLFKKINKFLPYFIVMGIPFIFLCEFVILKLYGKEYPFNPLWAILLGIASMCIWIDGIYGWTLSSVGKEGVRIVSLAAVILALLNIVLNIKLIPLVGILGAIISIILAFIVSIIIILSFGKKHLCH